jgi:hydrogenase maturation protease
MRDDGLGILVARVLKERELGKDVSVEEHSAIDLGVIQNLQDASKLIVVDSVKSGKEAGTLTKYAITTRKGELTELPNLHSLKLTDVIDLAMSSGILRCPVVIIGVEPKDDSPGIGLSREVESALQQVIAEVIREIS